ncbi:deoxyribonuclease IV [Jatrophihabitans endophyticus]|uniref:deoxyribonuclease IV n=1 Tax=Jatrophihabitans endophyticus TaxID=1206085 RepID=UPI0019E9A5D5|nr:deoxyribonuclease IV [Jatrophihabitans endophyticus]MBE7189175.1 deoxyribonuclease IV [Jatrophihabitans endophyticus]
MTSSRSESAGVVGAHAKSDDPLAWAGDAGAAAVQFFLTDPQAWKAPPVRDDADALRATSVAVYVHAPYRINVATTNNRIRVPSRKLLMQHAQGAAELGARGIVVHGGHLAEGDDPSIGVENWRKTFAYAANDGGYPLPVLIENTAGGTNAVARRFDRLARLWDAVGDLGAGFCLDTCHAFAGGEDLSGIVERVLSITGRIDLVHANDSRDAFDSGADRHANLGAGTIDAATIADVCRAAGCDVVVETPGGPDAQRADIDLLRASM